MDNGGQAIFSQHSAGHHDGLDRADVPAPADAVTVPMSFTPDRFMSMPKGELSLRHYETLVIDPIWRGAIFDSVVVGLGAMVLALAVGSAAAIGLWQIGATATRYIGILPMLPLIVPPIVSALALSRAAVWLGMLDTYPALVGSHAIVGIPFVFMTVSAALERVNPRILQAGHLTHQKQLCLLLRTSYFYASWRST